MECEHKKLTREQFNGKVKLFDSRKELLLFILNTISLIIHNGHHYCYCEKFGEKKGLLQKIVKCVEFQLFFITLRKTLKKIGSMILSLEISWSTSFPPKSSFLCR